MLQKIPDNSIQFFWVNPKTGRSYHPSWNKKWFEAKTGAGIVAEFRRHDLRYDSAVQVYEATHDLGVVKDLLGHMTPRRPSIGTYQANAATRGG
ncbi:MAG: hypothetical protein LDL33_14805 [Desulfomonile sp.]|nr:hypothetical protein [Desulfomonile sp.]